MIANAQPLSDYYIENVLGGGKTFEDKREMIKTARKQRHLTQGELGELIGVKKAQISRLENNANNVTIDTIMRVFQALKAKVSFNVELLDGELKIA